MRSSTPLCAPWSSKWPWHIKLDIEGVETAFVHYPLSASGQDFAQFFRTPTADDLDGLFNFPPGTGTLNFFGHTHSSCDLNGRAHYVNPGSLGCHTEAMARYVIVTFRNRRYTIEHRTVHYDDASLFADLERRQVPDRALIRSVFFSR
jgi:predicted phosphodiesterase